MGDRPRGFGQIGCIYTAQGFEYDWNGVIFGTDLVWREDRWVAQPKASKDPALRGLSAAAADPLLRNVYKVAAHPRHDRHNRLLDRSRDAGASEIACQRVRRIVTVLFGKPASNSRFAHAKRRLRNSGNDQVALATA